MNFDDIARGGTACLSKAGLAVGGTATGVALAAPNGAGTDFAINGTIYHKADAATVAITAAAEQAEETTCLYLVCLNASGTLSTVKGTEQLTEDLTAGTAVLDWPTPVADTCPIGCLHVVVTGDGVTFTAGTTSLAASGVTTTYRDLMCIPVAPLTS